MEKSDPRKAEDLLAALRKTSDPVDPTPLLISLLLDGDHEQQEDVVFELGLIGAPTAVPAIAQAIVIPFDHMVEWGNLHEFQRKCAYTLARIGTEESRAILQKLSEHSEVTRT